MCEVLNVTVCKRLRHSSLLMLLMLLLLMP